jgi:nicotinate-nucleotide pyrophosphorylase (carboxylating)
MSTCALMPLPAHVIDEAITRALQEDLGFAGDITSAATIPPGQGSEASIVAREGGVVAGLALARAAFQTLDPHIVFTAHAADGQRVEAGMALAQVSGDTRAILGAERVALNFFGRMSGIATLTAQYAAAVAHTDAKITCTRKTTPGLRAPRISQIGRAHV